MNLLMLTWTDVFYAIGDFFLWFFQGIRAITQGPNVFFGILIVFGIVYWSMRLSRYRSQARRQGTLE